MENRNIIIILTAIIVVLAIVLSIMFSLQMAKEESNLNIVDKTINAGDSLVVVLTDSHGNPIANETVNVKLTDKDGKVVDKKLPTNSRGKAKLPIDEKGEFSVECKFNGNDNYASSSVADNVKVEKATTELVSEEKTSTSASQSSSGLSEDGYSYYPEYGPAVDSAGTTREEAIAKNMHYIEMTVDGDRPGEKVTVGGYVAYDPNAGCYHT